MPRSARAYSRRTTRREHVANLVARLRSFSRNVLMRLGGLALILIAGWLTLALADFSISDPSLNTATPAPVANAAGLAGAIAADLLLQLFGGAAFLLVAPLALWGGVALFKGAPLETPPIFWRRLALAPAALICGAAFAAVLPTPAGWPLTCM